MDITEQLTHESRIALAAAAEITRLRAERDHARDCLDNAVKLLTGIHALLYPAPVTTDDGRTMVFRPKDPDPHEVLQALSDRIRALPDALATLDGPNAKVSGDDDYDDYEPPPPPRRSTGHEWDDDAVCIHCGFDGAEWHHWKHHTYEGKAQPEAKPPLCTRRA